MKVKAKLTDLQATSITDNLEYLISEIEGKNLTFQFYCHIENLRTLKFYIDKRLITSQKDKVNIQIDHNTIFSLYTIGIAYKRDIDVLTTCIINDLMETAGQKKEFQYRKQLAAKI